MWFTFLFLVVLFCDCALGQDQMQYALDIKLSSNCRTCQIMFDDHWADESARANLCWQTPVATMMKTENCTQVMGSGKAATGYQFCAMTGVCPSMRDVCLERFPAAVAPPLDTPAVGAGTVIDGRTINNAVELVQLTELEKQNMLCKMYNELFGIDTNACRGAFDDNSLSAEDFCDHNPYFNLDDQGGIVPMECANPIVDIECDATNGVLKKYASEVRLVVEDSDLGISKTYSILDECAVNQQCTCASGFEGADCTVAVAVPEVALVERKPHNLTMSRVRHKKHPDLKPLSFSSYKMGSPVNGDPPCDGSSWAYYQDSLTDFLGFPASDICGIAIKQDKDYVDIAVSMGGYLGCEILFIAGAPVYVCLGDMMINLEVDENGNHVPLTDAMNSGMLYGVRMQPEADSNLPMTGVYKNAKFVDVGPSNQGYALVQEYLDLNGATNPGEPHMGGGIDSYANGGQGYLGGMAYNSLLSGDLASETPVEHNEAAVEWTDDETSPTYPFLDDWSQMDHAKLMEMGLDWESNIVTSNEASGSICTTTMHSRVPRDAFPPEARSVLLHTAMECYNDAFGAKFELCSVISPSRTPSTSPPPPPPAGFEESPSPSPVSYCTCFAPGGLSSDYNTISLENFVGGSDTEGKLGVCGNAELTAYSIGGMLEPTHDITFFVNGDLNVVTGDLKFGDMKVGGTADLGESFVNGMKQGKQVVKNETSSDYCNEITTYYNELSADLANHHSYGAAEFAHEDDSEITVRRLETGGDNVVFLDVDCDTLASVNHLKFEGVNIGETLVVNFRGFEVDVDGNAPEADIEPDFITCNLEAMQISVVDPQRTVFNFNGVTNITLDAVSITASVLAPAANFVGLGGMITGQSVFKDFQGVTQQNLLPCLGCLDVAQMQSPAPSASRAPEAFF